MSDTPSKSQEIVPTSLLLAAALGLLVSVAPLLRAQTFTTLYTFCSRPACADGEAPGAGVIMDKLGNLYGTTELGGASVYGTVFELTPSGTETVLYNFCSASHCTDGQVPSAGLAFGKKGNLYGTTSSGGAYNYGTVFEVTPSGTETVLHSFASGADGAYPAGGVVFDKKGNLYGTTSAGGAYGAGTVFEITAKGREKVLHSFVSNSPDGAFPSSGLVLDAKGNLYGTTSGGGGATGCGTVFEVTPTGTETVLYSFAGASDGCTPLGGVVFDKSGNLYGTTFAGGLGSCTVPSGCGIVFKLTPTGAETVLYSFAGGLDAERPRASLVLDAKGNLHGTTSFGGSGGWGTDFELMPSGGVWTETILHSFYEMDYGCPPASGLLRRKEAFYGTTGDYGISGPGTVYVLTP